MHCALGHTKIMHCLSNLCQFYLHSCWYWLCCHAIVCWLHSLEQEPPSPNPKLLISWPSWILQPQIKTLSSFTHNFLTSIEFFPILWKSVATSNCLVSNIFPRSYNCIELDASRLFFFFTINLIDNWYNYGKSWAHFIYVYVKCLFFLCVFLFYLVNWYDF